jgi:hypothetical protein
MPTIVKAPSGTWQALASKVGFPISIKAFRLSAMPKAGLRLEAWAWLCVNNCTPSYFHILRYWPGIQKTAYHWSWS